MSTNRQACVRTAPRPSIHILSTFLTKRHSGTAQSTIAIANALSDRGLVSVSVDAFEIESGILRNGINTRILPPLRPRRFLWRVERLLNTASYSAALASVTERPADLTYTQSMEFAIVFRRMNKKTRLVTHFGHVLAAREALDSSSLGQPWRDIGSFLSERLESKCYKLLNTLHVVSTSLVGSTRADAFRVPNETFFVHPLGIESERFIQTGQRDSLRRKLGLRPESFVIATVARLVGWKQVDWLIRSMTKLPDSYVLLIAGEGEEREALEELTRQSELKARVLFLGHVDPVPVLEMADVFALPSRIESFGMVYAEAMSMGLPCIGLRYAPPQILSTAQDVIQDQECGILVENQVELTEAIRFLAEHPERRLEMGINAKNRASTLYSVDRYASFLESFVLKIREDDTHSADGTNVRVKG